ncbi:MAG: hypothetical protein RL173_2858 [Fibrobacterota bacterium]|jgi:hypothetical protein
MVKFALPRYSLKGGLAALLFILCSGWGLYKWPPIFVLGVNEECSNGLKSYSLIDSIPSLDSSLHRFEAYRLYDSSSEKSNASGNLSYAKTGARLSKFEYLRGQGTNDSLILLSWADDGVIERQTIVGVAAQGFSREYNDTIYEGWVARHVVFSSFPRSIPKNVSTTIQAFDQIEGTFVHEISGHYVQKVVEPKKPDTAYRAPFHYSDIEVLLNGSNLAIINGSKNKEEVAVYGPKMGWRCLSAKAGYVSVFRDCIKWRESFLVAYTTRNLRLLPYIGRNETRRYFYLQ